MTTSGLDGLEIEYAKVYIRLYELGLEREALAKKLDELLTQYRSQSFANFKARGIEKKIPVGQSPATLAYYRELLRRSGENDSA